MQTDTNQEIPENVQRFVYERESKLQHTMYISIISALTILSVVLGVFQAVNMNNAREDLKLTSEMISKHTDQTLSVIKEDYTNRALLFEKTIEGYDASFMEMKQYISDMQNQKPAKPILEVVVNGIPLNGRILDVEWKDNTWLVIPSMDIVNSGDRTNEQFSCKLYLSDCSGNQSIVGGWSNSRCDISNYKYAYICGDRLQIPPREMLSIPSLEIDSDNPIQNDIQAKLVVLYDAHTPCTAEFVIRKMNR